MCEDTVGAPRRKRRPVRYTEYDERAACYRSSPKRRIPGAARAAILAMICGSLSGCSTFNEYTDIESSRQLTGIDKHSAFPTTRREYFERINLLELIDPERNAPIVFHSAWDLTNKGAHEGERPSESPSEYEANAWGVRYDLAFALFRQRVDISDEAKRRMRNSIQERMISASLARCNVFKTFLRRDQTNVNFHLGVLTTASGVLGAVLPGATASRNLAGAAGLFSGIRAEYDQTYYSNLAAHVIVKGIEAKQEQIYRRMQLEGQKKGIDDYPLEAAVKDAVFFDGLCSVVNGLDQAATSVDSTSEPGLEAATRTLLRARIARETLDLPKEQLLDPATLDRIGMSTDKLGMSLVGSARGAAGDQPSEAAFLSLAASVDAMLRATINGIGDELEAAVISKRKSLIEKLSAAAKERTPASAFPADGSIKNSFVAAAVSGIVEPLHLQLCQTQVVLPAAKARLDAVAKAQAPTADEKAKKAGELAVHQAEFDVQSASGRLNQMAHLAQVDLQDYRASRLAVVSSVGDVAALTNGRLQQLLGTPTASASKQVGCSEK